MYIYVHVCVLSRVQLFVTLWTVAHQASPRIYIYIYIYPRDLHEKPFLL